MQSPTTDDDIESSLTVIKRTLKEQKSILQSLSSDGLPAGRWYFLKIYRLLRIQANNKDLKFCNLEGLSSSYTMNHIDAEISRIVLNKINRGKNLQSIEMAKEMGNNFKLNKWKDQFGQMPLAWTLVKRELAVLVLLEAITAGLIYLACCLLKEAIYSIFMWAVIEKYLNLTDFQQEFAQFSGKHSSNLLHVFKLVERSSVDQSYEEDIGLSSVIWHIFAFLVTFVLLRISFQIVDYLRSRLKLRYRQGLNLLLFDKLSRAGYLLLEKTDYTVVSKLFISELDTLCETATNVLCVVPLFLLSIVIITYFRGSGFVILLVAVGFHVMVCTSTYLVYTLYKSLQTKCTQASEAKRRILYELIVNFKSIKLKDLTEHYRSRIDAWRKHEVQNKRHCLSISVINTASAEFLSSIISALSVYSFMNYLQDQQEKISFGQMILELFNFVVNLIGLTVLLVYFETLLKRLLFSIMAPGSKCKSLELYKTYFNVKSESNSDPKDDHKVAVGTLEFDECQVEANESALAEQNVAAHEVFQPSATVGLLTTTLKHQQSMAHISIAKEREQPKMRTELRRILQPSSNSVSLEIEVESSVSKEYLPEDEKKADSGISCKIKFGEVICLYGDAQSSYSEFLDIILGEATIKKGSFRKQGTISHLNTSEGIFIPGKSIYDNILMGGHYDPDRYTRVLKALSLSFSIFNGGDFYQISDNATNLSTFYRKMILVARFLYQLADIYIIENLFKEKSALPMQIDLDDMFDIISGNTIIFASNDQNFIRKSERVFVFKNKKLIREEKTEQFLMKVIQQKTINQMLSSDEDSDEEEFEDKEYDFKNKALNLLQGNKSINYDHELKLYKKNIQVRNEAEAKLSGEPLINRVVFGLFHAQKRRDEGQNITRDSYSYSGIKVWLSLKTSLNISRRFKISLVITALTQLLTFKVSELVSLVILQLVFNAVATRDMGSLLNWLDYKWMAIMCIIVSLNINIMMRIILTQGVLTKSDVVHQKILNRIISHEYFEHQRYRHFHLFGLMIESQQELEIFLTEMLVDIGLNLVIVLRSLLILNIIFPLTYLVATVVLAVLLKMICSGVLKLIWVILPIRRIIGDKALDFLFQLPNLITTNRNMQTIEELRNLFKKLQDNRALASFRYSTDLELWLASLCTAVNVAMLIIGVIYVLLAVMNHNVGWSNNNIIIIMWSISVNTEMNHRLLNLLNGLSSLANRAANLISIHTFLSKQADDALGIRTLEAEMRHSDLTHLLSHQREAYIVLFKKVHLTMGLKLQLKNVNLKVKHKQKVALIGCDGVGRSYILNIIAGIDKPDKEDNDKSEVWVLQHRLTDNFSLPPDARHKVDVLERNICLCEGTVRSNLDPEGKFTDEELIEVLRKFYEAPKLRRRLMQRDNTENYGAEMSMMTSVQKLGHDIVPKDVKMMPEPEAELTHKVQSTDFEQRSHVKKEFRQRNAGSVRFISQKNLNPLLNIPEGQESEVECTDPRANGGLVDGTTYVRKKSKMSASSLQQQQTEKRILRAATMASVNDEGVTSGIHLPDPYMRRTDLNQIGPNSINNQLLKIQEEQESLLASQVAEHNVPYPPSPFRSLKMFSPISMQQPQSSISKIIAADEQYLREVRDFSQEFVMDKSHIKSAPTEQTPVSDVDINSHILNQSHERAATDIRKAIVSQQQVARHKSPRMFEDDVDEQHPRATKASLEDDWQQSVEQAERVDEESVQDQKQLRMESVMTPAKNSTKKGGGSRRSWSTKENAIASEALFKEWYLDRLSRSDCEGPMFLELEDERAEIEPFNGYQSDIEEKILRDDLEGMRPSGFSSFKKSKPKLSSGTLHSKSYAAPSQVVHDAKSILAKVATWAKGLGQTKSAPLNNLDSLSRSYPAFKGIQSGEAMMSNSHRAMEQTIGHQLYNPPLYFSGGPGSKIESVEEKKGDVEDAFYLSLLDMPVAFSGRNLGSETKKLINASRCVLRRPELVLFWEESLNFGSGIEANTKVLFDELKNAAVLSVLKDCRTMLFYDKVALIDSGTVVESGKPLVMMQDRNTVIFHYVKETDPRSYKYMRKHIRNFRQYVNEPNYSMQMSRTSEYYQRTEEPEMLFQNREELSSKKDSFDQSRSRQRHRSIMQIMKKRNRTADEKLNKPSFVRPDPTQPTNDLENKELGQAEN